MKKPEKDKVVELWQEKITGELSEKDEKMLSELLKENEALALELKEMEQTWQLFEEIERPEPSDAMDAKFEGMMTAYTDKNLKAKPSIMDQLVAQLSGGWKFGLVTLSIGLFIGWWMLPTQDQKKDIQELSSEIQSLKEMMMLTLIEQPKAQERIRAVNLAAELPNADQKVITALITTLNYDNNINVRLASLESLTQYLDQAEVRHALVNALKIQDSPLLQVAIADILVQIQEKSSLETMESLKEKVEDKLVKEKLEQSIRTLRKS